MNYLSKAASRPRVIGGFAAVLAAGAFLGALALAGPSDETTPFDSSTLDPNGLMIAMSLEDTNPQQVALAAPRIESPKVVSPACSWENDGVAELCRSDWPYPKVVSPACSWENDGVAELCRSDWPYPDVHVAKPATSPCYDSFGDVTACESDAPRQETVVAHAMSDRDGASVCGPEINDDDPLICLDD